MRTLKHLLYVVQNLLILLASSLGQDSNLFIVVNSDTSSTSSSDGNIVSLTDYSTKDTCQCNVSEGTETYLRFKEKSYRVEQCVEDEISFLDVCNGAFEGNYSFNISSTSSSGDGVYENKTALCQFLEETRAFLFNFEVILDQTLVCVYVESCENKTRCLEAYTKWICVTQLMLYETSTTTTDDGTAITGNNGVNYTRAQPCLSECETVLQRCPYYIPSDYQPNHSGAYITGGYPAFNCPAVDRLSANSNYSIDNTCIGKGSVASTLSSYTSILILCTISILTFI